jgi:drug/metabolite transporter (DMT)-like permease
MVHIVALSLGPLTVVQPMGVASLLFALPIAAALEGRRPGRAEIAAAGAVSAGLIGLVLLVPKPTGIPHLTTTQAAALLAGPALVALLCRMRAGTARPVLKAGLLAVGAGVMYGATATLIRVLIVDGDRQLWLALAIPVPMVTALALLQGAYSVGHFPVAYAAAQMTDPLTAVTLGVVLLGEPLPEGTGGALATVAAAVLAAAGTVSLARTSPMTR